MEKAPPFTFTETNTTRWKMLNNRVQRNNATKKFFVPVSHAIAVICFLSYIHFRRRVKKNFILQSTRSSCLFFLLPRFVKIEKARMELRSTVCVSVALICVEHEPICLLLLTSSYIELLYATLWCYFIFLFKSFRMALEGFAWYDSKKSLPE